MKIEHLDHVARLERLCYPDRPLDRDDLGPMIRELNTSGYVAIDNKIVVAYVIFDTADGEVRILRLGVHPEKRGRGLAWRLVNRVKIKLTAKKDKLMAVVSDKMTAGHLFLVRQGFVAKRVIRTVQGDSYEFIFRRDWMDKVEVEQEPQLMHQIDTTEVDL
jgi:ribosomal protein S18 acetylase RimI-like enzyme